MKTPTIVVVLCFVWTAISGLNPSCLLCHDIVRALQKSVKSKPF